LFGDVPEGGVRLNELGEAVRRCWLSIPDHFPHTRLDEFVVMPNHVHGIIWIVGDIGNIGRGEKSFAPTGNHPRGTSKTIGAIIRGFKIGVTKWARQHMGVDTVWQRNYYEHVIRNERSLNKIRQYIHENPLRWHLDRENPAAEGEDTDWESWANL